MKSHTYVTEEAFAMITPWVGAFDSCFGIANLTPSIDQCVYAIAIVLIRRFGHPYSLNVLLDHLHSGHPFTLIPGSFIQ